MGRSTRASYGIIAAIAFGVAMPSLARADDTHDAASAAQEHYSAGRESYRAGLFGRALEEFERSLALAPSPNTRLYLARALRELGRWSEAADQFRETIREAEARGGKYVATRDAADMELRDVKVRIERGDPSKIDKGDKSEKSDKADKNDKNDKNDKSEKNDKPSRDEVVAPAPLPPPAASTSSAHSPTTLTWVSGGVAVAGAASFAVFYALAGGRYGYLENNCTSVRDAACDSARSTGKTEEVVAYVSLGVAAAATVVAVVSLMTGPASSTTAARTPKMEPWRLAF